MHTRGVGWWWKEGVRRRGHDTGLLEAVLGSRNVLDFRQKKQLHAVRAAMRSQRADSRGEGRETGGGGGEGAESGIDVVNLPFLRARGRVPSFVRHKPVYNRSNQWEFIITPFVEEKKLGHEEWEFLRELIDTPRIDQILANHDDDAR